MSEVMERSQERMENIAAIEPILRALRTVSMGSWQASLKMRTSVQKYRTQFSDIYRHVLPRLAGHTPPQTQGTPAVKNLLALVIGTEQGLIGKFNRDLADYALGYLAEQEKNGFRVKFFLLGSRLMHTFRQKGIHFEDAQPLSTTSLPAFAVAAGLAHRWLSNYEAYRVDAVDIMHNSYFNPSLYETSAQRLIPFSPQNLTGTPAAASWPAPIIETDPASLYTRLVQQEIAIRLFESLLDSAASEHSSRYQLMEEAVQNSERLIEELNIDLQTIRRQQITREMQELAAGAGLLD